MLWGLPGCEDEHPGNNGGGSLNGNDSAPAQPRILFPAVNDGKWGFIDSSGQVVVDFKFEAAERFSEGLAPIKSDGMWGFVNLAGRMAIQPRFEAVHYTGFVEGHVAVMLEEKWGCIDNTGRMVIKPSSETPIEFREGLAPGMNKDKFGFMDVSGKMTIPEQFVFARPFSESLAAVYLGGRRVGRRVMGGRWGFVDRLGNIAVQPRFARVSDFSHGMAAVDLFAGATGDYRTEFGGYIDYSGEIVISAGNYDRGEGFSGGFAEVRSTASGLWAFIDTTGSERIKPRFVNTRRFSEGLAAVQVSVNGAKAAKWGYVDDRGVLVIPAVYDRAGDFDRGLAAVRVDSMLGYINIAGEYVREPGK
jgi:hypothetical protein